MTGVIDIKDKLLQRRVDEMAQQMVQSEEHRRRFALFYIYIEKRYPHIVAELEQAVRQLRKET
jgi:hypothetical protein